MPKIAKTITDRTRLDFLIKYGAPAPVQLPDGNWTLTATKNVMPSTFTATTPRMAIDLAIIRFEGRKLYTYRVTRGQKQ